MATRRDILRERKTTKSDSSLLAAVRETDSSVTWAADCLCPNKFDTVVRAVKNLCGFNETSNRYNISSRLLPQFLFEAFLSRTQV